MRPAINDLTNDPIVLKIMELLALPIEVYEHAQI